MINNLLNYFSNPVVIHKLLRSGIVIIVLWLALFFVRRFINSLKIDVEKRRQYLKIANRTAAFLSLLILIPIWTVTNLFSYLNNSKTVMGKLVTSGLAFLLVYLSLFFVRRLINSLKIGIAKRHQYRKRASYTATFIYFIILISIWAGNGKQWATLFSLLGAGIALALHEVLLNIAGWVYIMARRPYREGDRIELGNVRGDVIDIRLFQTTLLEIGNWVGGDQSTGRLVNLPHGQIFKNPLYNYTKGFEFLWNEMSILVTFESNWEKARKILLKCGEEESKDVQEKVKKEIERMSREYLIYYRKFTPIVYTEIGESGIKLTLRYLTEAKERRIVEDKLSRKILTEIGKTPDVVLAYPTYRIYKKGEKGES